MSQGQQVSFLKRVMRDVVLAIGIVSAACLLALYEIKADRRVPFRWIEFVGMTPIIFWVVLKQFRRHWCRPRLWFAALALLGVHVTFFSVVLLRYPEWPAVWLLPVGLVEGWALFLVLYKLVVGHLR